VINATGSGLVYSTYLGLTQDYNFRYGIAVDLSGSAYVTGQTDSSTFPTTSGSWQTNFIGSEDVFVSKLNAAGSALVYSTFLGGSGVHGAAIAIDGSDNAYITGPSTRRCAISATIRGDYAIAAALGRTQINEQGPGSARATTTLDSTPTGAASRRPSLARISHR
jgi:hypothetical protein